VTLSLRLCAAQFIILTFLSDVLYPRLSLVSLPLPQLKSSGLFLTCALPGRLVLLQKGNETFYKAKSDEEVEKYVSGSIAGADGPSA